MSSAPLLDTTPTIYRHTYGQGAHAYLGLHGWAADYSTFDAMAKDVPANSALHSIDLPGYGRSETLDQWTLETLKHALIDCITQLPAHETLTIIGSCSGAVLTLAALHRELEDIGVDRLVLLEPFAFVPDYLEIFLKPGFGKLAYWSTFCNPIGRAITDAAIKRQNIAQEHGTSNAFAKVNPWVPYHYLHLMAQLGKPEQFAHLTCEIDIITGEHTFDAIKDSVAIWSGIWPQARCHVLQDVGHMLIQEAPHRLAHTIFTKTP